MKSTVIIYRKITDYLSKPLIFISAFVLLTGLIPFIKADDAVGLLSSAFFPLYLVYSVSKNAQKGIICAFCLVSSDLIYYSFSKEHFGVLFTVLISVLLSKFAGDVRISYLFTALFITGAVLSVSAGLIYPLLYEYLKVFSSLITGRGFLFGAVKSIYDILFSDKFSYLFYHTDFGSSTVNSNGVFSGAVDIFKSDPESRAVSIYLTGRYFVNIFLSLGLFFALFKRLSYESKFAFAAVLVSGIITGDVRLLSLFIILFNPFVFIAYFFVSGAAYFVPDLINLKIGFNDNASIIELIKYGNKWGYFLVTGFVLALLMYFAVRLVIAKFRLSDGNYYPSKVRKIVSFLGGEDNIKSVKQNKVTVNNPNLINIISLDCDIHGNMVILNREDSELIEGYF